MPSVNIPLFTTVANEAAAVAVMNGIFGGDQSLTFSKRFSADGNDPATHGGGNAPFNDDQKAQLIADSPGNSPIDYDLTHAFWPAAAARNLTYIEPPEDE